MTASEKLLAATSKAGHTGDLPCPSSEGGHPCAEPACADELLRDYTLLRERYRRTTDALTSAAHDLKTPLAILNGYVEMLQSEKLGALNDRQRAVLADMQLSGQQLQRFIQDFLTFSGLETGALKLQCIVADMNQCLAEVCHLWSPRFQEKSIALYFLTNDKLTTFPFDLAKVQRVVSNLLENASKFTPAGGTVWLHAEPYVWERRSATKAALALERRRHDSAAPNSVKVSVTDTGPGVPPEYHQEIFDDFFRLPADGSVEGMGLGLSIARRLVLAMGGRIWIENDLGAGSKFSFLLPHRPPQQEIPGDSTRGQN